MRGLVLIAAAGALAGVSGEAMSAQAVRTQFGRLPDGRAVEAIELANGRGVRARIIAFGATLQSLMAPDRQGRSADIVLGHDELDDYVGTPNYLGTTVGRYANRIAQGRFSIDGKTYHLARNNGPNALHGGNQGFDKRLWTIGEVRSSSVASVRMSYRSADGEEGYPGVLDVSVTYSLDEANALTISYEARSSAPTVINLTNHSFFNLGGASSGKNIFEHRLMIAADSFTPVDEVLIPTGEVRSVTNTPFDFRNTTVIGTRIREGRDPQLRYGMGYDHNWVLRSGKVGVPRLAARLEDPFSGRVLELLTTEPGLQFYSGNFLDGKLIGKGGSAYRQSDGLCLEPQHFPDSPNHPKFPSTRLDPGQVYLQVSVFRLSTVE